MDEPHESINSPVKPSKYCEDNYSTWTHTEIDFVLSILQECHVSVTREQISAQSKSRWHIEFSKMSGHRDCYYRSGENSSKFHILKLENWIENGSMEAMLEFVWESYISCAWLELRRLLGFLLIEAAKIALSENIPSDFMTRNRQNVLEKMVLDVDPSICTAATQAYLQTGSFPNETTLLNTIGHLVTHRKSKKVRYVACSALTRALDCTPGLDRLLALLLGSKLLKMSRLDPSVYSRAAALKAINKLFAVDAFPMSITDVANLVSTDDHPALLRQWAYLLWSVILLGIAEGEDSSFLARVLEVVRLVKTGTLSDHQGAIILAHQETNWQSCCQLLQHDLADHSSFPDTLKLLVTWTGLLASMPKSLHVNKKIEPRLEAAEEINSVLGLLNMLQSDEMKAEGIHLLCNVMVQGKYREFEAIEMVVDRVIELFVSTSTPGHICVIGDFFQSLYEDPYYKARISAKLDVLAALILSSKDGLYIHKFAALCGTVLKPSQELGQMEPDAIARFIQAKVEFVMHVDHETVHFIERIIQLCPKFPDKLILILKTVGKYSSRAKIHQWPLPNFPIEICSWLIEYLKNFNEADRETLVECILGLWYYNAIPDELIANVRRILSEQGWTCKELELIET